MKKNYIFTNYFRTIGQSDMATIKCKRIFTLVLVLILFVANVSQIFANNLPDYSDLKDVINAAYMVRSDLLQNSTGTASAVLEKTHRNAEETQKLKDSFSEELGIDPDSFTFVGKGEWNVTWYKNGLRDRYDINVPLSETNDGGQPLLIKKDMRISVDPEKGIYYDVLHNEAYINRPANPGGNISSLVRNFDINKLYQFNSKSLPDLLAWWDGAGLKPQITEDQIGQIRCIKLQFNHAFINSNGKERKSRLELWVAPEMSYSLVKAQQFGNMRSVGEPPKLIESYEATYQKSTVEGVWLLKEAVILSKQGPVNQKLSINFSDTKVGIEIPDETFTFEGLGVPVGTKLFDKRFGQSIQTYYKGLPKKELDMLVDKIDLKQTSETKQQTKDIDMKEATNELIKNTEHSEDSIVTEDFEISKSHHWVVVSILVALAAVLLIWLFSKLHRARRSQL